MRRSYPLFFHHVFRMVILLAAFLTASTPLAMATAEVSATVPYALYASTTSMNELHQLDPTTLTDLGDARMLESSMPWPQLATSADGSTFVLIYNDQIIGEKADAEPSAIVIQDGVHGKERLRIPLKGDTAFSPLLSADGSRLVVQVGTLMCGPSGCGPQSWFCYDTRTGKRISTIEGPNDPAWPSMIDAGGHRLYVPFTNRSASSTPVTTATAAAEGAKGPWPLQIAGYDLDTGREIAHLTLPNVMAGSWQQGMIDQMPRMETVQPAIALSPDGTGLAVIDAGMQTLTVVAADTLKITATHDLHRSASKLEQLARWLGIAPQPAAAKALEETTLNATFSPDGAQLYLWGDEITIGASMDDIEGHGLGLMRVDLGTGTIADVGLGGKDLVNVLVAPDGASLYVVAQDTPWWENQSGAGSGYTLRRLDGKTLKVIASREFSSWPRVELLAVDQP